MTLLVLALAVCPGRALAASDVPIPGMDELTEALPEEASLKEEEETKLKEGREVLMKLKPSDFLVLLDLGKEEMTSPELAKKFSKWMEISGSNLTFVIGGSLGLSQELRNRGNATLTLSSLTFTHQMTRIILLEQIYRSFKILKNEPYHK